MSWLTTTNWQLLLAGGTFLAGVHAFRKLSPYFAITWFGSALVFAWFWTSHDSSPEALLLPGLVVYLGAALSKGLVEQGSLAGNHIVHVLATGVLTGLVALPLESVAIGMNLLTPRDAPLFTPGWLDGAWMGGVSTDLFLQWMLVGAVFYGTYKILDHIGLGSVLQTILLFAVMPFLPLGIDKLIAALA